jgi:hypothetical protein
VRLVINHPAAALYIQPPMFETTVAIQSVANTRYRKAASGDVPLARFSTDSALPAPSFTPTPHRFGLDNQSLLGTASGNLYYAHFLSREALKKLALLC